MRILRCPSHRGQASRRRVRHPRHMTRHPALVGFGEACFGDSGALQLGLQRHAVLHRVAQRLRTAPILHRHHELAVGRVAFGLLRIEIGEQQQADRPASACGCACEGACERPAGTRCRRPAPRQSPTPKAPAGTAVAPALRADPTASTSAANVPGCAAPACRSARKRTSARGVAAAVDRPDIGAAKLLTQNRELIGHAFVLQGRIAGVAEEIVRDRTAPRHSSGDLRRRGRHRTRNRRLRERPCRRRSACR